MGKIVRTRTTIVAGILALVAASCGSGSARTEAPLGLIQQGDSASLQVLAYAYEPDSSLYYGFSLDMTMNATMDFPDLGGSGDISMGMGMDGALAYDIAPGTVPGSVAVTMRSDIRDFDLDYFTMDGQSVADQLSPSDLEAMRGENALPEITVVVSETGEVLELRYGDTALPSDFLSGFGSSGFSDPTGMSLTNLFGPEMPVEDVGVGAEWAVDDSQEIPGIGTIESRTHYWVTDETEFRGRNVLVIVSATTIEDIEMDLMEMMESMLTMDQASLEAMGMDAGELAQMQREMFDGMEMNMGFSYDSIETTTYFDPADGIMVWTNTVATTTGTMEMRTPEGNGTMTFDMDMDMELMLADEATGA